MDRDGVLTILRQHEAQLRSAGVQRLRLFGSVARGDQNSGSDVDLAIRMDPTRRWTLFTLGGIYEDLREMLGTKIDVALLDNLRSSVAERVEREGVDAF